MGPMTQDVKRLAAAGSWQIVSTLPWNGDANMAFDRELLVDVSAGTQPPTVRFFRWQEPGISFGRLQDEAQVRAASDGLPIVRRPTGGGVVRHGNDLCVSFCWPNGLAGVPKRPQDQYAWIHALLQKALSNRAQLDMLACCDAPKSSEAFETRQCFTNPVGSDLLKAGRKVVGGALARQKGATLYQGSIQNIPTEGLEAALALALTPLLLPS
jgi:lipoate-protein ligase A